MSTQDVAPVHTPTRPSIIGTESGPEPPYPIKMYGIVERGFGRGSRELGIPTANLPRSSIDPLERLGSTGIYFGFAKLHPIPSSSSSSSSNNNSTTTTTTAKPTNESNPGSEGLSVQTIHSLPGKTAAYPEAQVQGKENDKPQPGQHQARDVNVDVDVEAQGLKDEDYNVWPMVMSVGYNPYYGNKEMTAVSLSDAMRQETMFLDAHCASR